MYNSFEPFYAKKWFTSAAWSVGAHLIFILAALFINLGGFAVKPEKELMEFKLNKVQTNLVAPKGNGGGSGSPAAGKKTSSAQFPQGTSKGFKSLDPTKAGSSSRDLLSAIASDQARL